jgi:hypothetical protein
MQSAQAIQRAIDEFRARHNGPASPKEMTPHDFDRVQITVHFRNGNGNKLAVWNGKFVDFKPGHALAAMEESFQDAVARRSPIVEDAPHVRD